MRAITADVAVVADFTPPVGVRPITEAARDSNRVSVARPSPIHGTVRENSKHEIVPPEVADIEELGPPLPVGRDQQRTGLPTGRQQTAAGRGRGESSWCCLVLLSRLVAPVLFCSCRWRRAGTVCGAVEVCRAGVDR